MNTTQDEYARKVLRVSRHLEANLDEAIAPRELAKIAGMSLHHFHRVFRGQIGESVMEHVRRLRLERAARGLRTSDHAVVRIALEAGYGSHEAFTRAFTKHFGIAPRRYRDDRSTEVSQARAERTAPRLPVTIREEPERTVLYMRRVGLYSEVGKLWQQFFPWLMANGIPLRETLARVSDDPEVTPGDKLRYDACMVVDPEQPVPDGPVDRAVIAGGRYAIVTHKGPYEDLKDSYVDLIGRWFPQSGEALDDVPVIERYLNLPTEVAPADLRTEIAVRIR
ncbi:MAG: AraC family transcriptional regulator [Myxococcota bacterium]